MIELEIFEWPGTIMYVRTLALAVLHLDRSPWICLYEYEQADSELSHFGVFCRIYRIGSRFWIITKAILDDKNVHLIFSGQSCKTIFDIYFILVEWFISQIAIQIKIGVSLYKSEYAWGFTKPLVAWKGHGKYSQR